MDYSDKIARYQEIERRGLLDKLPAEKQELWAEYKRRQQPEEKDYTLGRLATFDKGATFGLGRKAGGLLNAVGSKIADAGYRAGEVIANVQNKGLKNAFDNMEQLPSFWDRYHEVVDPVQQAQKEYAEDKPLEALGLELGGALVNPANKVGAGYIGKGANLAGKIGRSTLVGSGIGGIAAGMDTENMADLPENTGAGVATGAVVGTALPIAGKAIGGTYNKLKQLFMPKASVAGKPTGLENIIKDNDSVRAVKRGIMASDDVANQVYEQAPTEMNRLNQELADVLDNTTGRKLDIQGALDTQQQRYNDFISRNADISLFNPKKAGIKNFTQGLNEFQEGALNQAINKGSTMSTNAKGTLGATHRAQEVLNDMIDASYDTSIIGQRRPTTETRQLMTVKERLNQILEPSGVKPYDAGISKAKALRANFEKGYNFKPSETKFENLGLDKERDKRAFLQGRIAKILDNVKDDKNLAKAIRDDENTLRKLMPRDKFNKLIKETSRIDREYGRMKTLAQMSIKTLDKPLAVDRPASERWESIGSLLGSARDRASAAMWTRANKLRAMSLLNGGGANPRWAEFIEGNAPNAAIFTPYLSEYLSNK